MHILIKGRIKEISKDSGDEIAVRIVTDGETHTQGESEVTLYMDESHADAIHIGRCTLRLEMVDA